MKELLQTLPDRGYPAEYLLSRIRGRRSRLIPEWKSLVFETAVQDYLSSARYQGFVKDRSADTIWKNLVREYRWVYGQMNGKLRDAFRPFFLYTELRTLFICLRNLKEKNPDRTADLLSVSLLSDGIKNILSTSPDAASAIQTIEARFPFFSGGKTGLTETFEADGLRAVEQRMTGSVLAAIIRARLHPIMRSFFARLIDARNILTLYKSLRLAQRSAPPLLPGGSLPEGRLRETVAREEIFGICTLVRDFSGVKIETPEPTRVEIALYKGITAYLKKEGREPFGAGPILDYLWKCSLEVMNLNVLIAGKDLERDLVASELVQ
ncbi:MAG: hypothetical protein A2010_06040 [Nitrospirae bacterium GWD2_57_9]|nr:MAG: hypothetical protein A2010_06040 [Nitrospirae bacterium GWD2_57_9]OGW50712.1 MAG: hypothetical protein A2078_05385 [Nitrospirae bacterium GWC2_57_9]